MRLLSYLAASGLLFATISIVRATTPQPIISSAPGLASSFTTLGVAEAAAPAAPSASTAAAPAAPAAAPAALAPAAAPSANGMSILGPPTVSPQLIDSVLVKYNSPATGKGQVIHDLGVKYGIDPAFLLAFFIHESRAGTSPRWAGLKPDGTTTHNVGNIICTSGWRCYGRFRDYESWEAGIEDWYRLLRDLYVGKWNRTTVEEIIPKYAPASDNNDEAAYIRQVRTMVESWRGN